MRWIVLSIMVFMVQIICAHGAAAEGIATNAAAEESMTIFEAVAADNVEALSRILKANPKAIHERRKHITPLHEAALSGQLAAARLLVESGADVNANVTGHAERGCVITPLYYACSKYVYNAMYGKRRSGGRVISGSPEKAAIYLELIKYLLEKKADPNTLICCYIGVKGETPLCMAAAAGEKDLVDLLLKNGAAVDFHGNSPISPFVHAVREGHADVAKFLLDNGAIISTNRNGWNPLHIACNAGSAETIAMLLNEKPELADAKTQKGETPLQIALIRGTLQTALQAYKKAGITVPDKIEKPLENLDP